MSNFQEYHLTIDISSSSNVIYNELLYVSRMLYKKIHT